jgi:glutathione synthase
MKASLVQYPENERMTTRKVSRMRVLFVMDPLKKLDKRWDNSLSLLNELTRRGHENWTADAKDLSACKSSVSVLCRQISNRVPARKRIPIYSAHTPKRFSLEAFDLVLIRKEPPVNAAFFEMLFLLERAASRVPMVNHPAGIRRTNEKLSILRFPKWIPKTLVTASPDEILTFQKRLKKPVVVKPLDQKGGKGVFLLPLRAKNSSQRLSRATRQGRETVMAQEFIKAGRNGEKRIVLLDGKVLGAYQKRAKAHEFRANLGLGATFHDAPLSGRERRLVAALRPYLLKNGLYFVGIDVLEGKLIEINVTSPAGVTEIKFLRPQLRPVEAWADFLERFAASRGRS